MIPYGTECGSVCHACSILRPAVQYPHCTIPPYQCKQCSINIQRCLFCQCSVWSVVCIKHWVVCIVLCKFYSVVAPGASMAQRKSCPTRPGPDWWRSKCFQAGSKNLLKWSHYPSLHTAQTTPCVSLNLDSDSVALRRANIGSAQVHLVQVQVQVQHGFQPKWSHYPRPHLASRSNYPLRPINPLPKPPIFVFILRASLIARSSTAGPNCMVRNEILAKCSEFCSATQNRKEQCFVWILCCGVLQQS